MAVYENLGGVQKGKIDKRKYTGLKPLEALGATS